MMPWEHFSHTFGFARSGASYSHKHADDIVAHRRALGGILFVDRLLQALGVDSPQKVYPPKSHSHLKELFKLVVASPSPSHHRQSLVYYLLRDFSTSPDSRDSHLKFARQCYLPEKYRLFVDGLWYLDHLDFQRALEYLTESSLIPTFPDEILHVLLTIPNRHRPTDPDYSLALAYYHTVSPPLASDAVLHAYFDALAHTSLADALFFTRTMPDPTRRALLTSLIASTLHEPNPSRRVRRALALVRLPLTPDEEAQLEQTLLDDQRNDGAAPSRLHGARDTVLMRRIGTGRVDEELERGVEALGGRKVAGVNWDDLKRNMRPGARAGWMAGGF